MGGSSQLVSNSTLSLDSSGFARIYPSTSAAQLQQNKNRSSRASDSCSVGGNESIYSTSTSHNNPNQRHQRHPAGSTSLTPPPSQSRNAVHCVWLHSKSRLDSMEQQQQQQLLNSELENLDDDDDDTDAFADLLPPHPSTAMATASVVAATTTQHRYSGGTGCSSPSSSTSMLPPPVFSHKFERILAPEPPPSTPPPPVPQQQQPIQSGQMVNLRASVMDNFLVIRRNEAIDN